VAESNFWTDMLILFDLLMLSVFGSAANLRHSDGERSGPEPQSPSLRD